MSGPLVLYYMDISPPARAVLMVIRNLKLKVELINVDLLKGDHLNETFLKLNPVHQIPVLIDGDFVLSESRAIATYLVNSKNPGCSLYPSNPKIRALIDQRLYYDATEVFPRNCNIIRAFFEEHEFVIPEQKKQKVEEAMSRLNSFLDGKKWFVGENYTLADISIITNVLQIKNCGYDIHKHSNLAAWYERCKQIPGFYENEKGAKAMGDMFRSKIQQGF